MTIRTHGEALAAEITLATELSDQTLSQLAESLACDRSNLNHWKSGRTIPKKDQLRKLLAACGLNAIKIRILESLRAEAEVERKRPSTSPVEILPWNTANDHGIIALNEGRLLEAREHLELATRIAPDKFVPVYNLGNLNWAAGEMEAALESYERAATLCPSSPKPANGIGNVLNQLGQIDEAKAAFERSIGLDSKYLWPYIGLGNIEHNKGNYKVAYALFTEAFKLDPENKYVVTGLSKAALARFKLIEAKKLQVALRSLPIQPTFPVYPDPAECW